jgi:ABC-type nitrate/sulfonate/bicarbonate transport system substrate-binding protein
MFRLMVADFDSPSYFVAIAAVELGFFKQQGIDIELERTYGAHSGAEKLRDGALHFFGGPAYAATQAFPGWKGAKLLCALSQYTYWFLAVRADLDVKRGNLGALKGLRISSSMATPVLALRHLLAQSGIDLERDKVRIVPAPPSKEGRWMGHAGVEAIKQGLADAYWGNGMRLAIGEKLGVAKLHLDLRRGDGPPGARWYNFAALTTTERLIEEQPQVAAGAVRAIVATQKALKADPSLATAIGERSFPPDEAPLIAGLIARDAPFYEAKISSEAVDGLNGFAQAMGLVSEPVPYERLVASQFRQLWNDQA